MKSRHSLLGLLFGAGYIFFAPTSFAQVQTTPSATSLPTKASTVPLPAEPPPALPPPTIGQPKNPPDLSTPKPAAPKPVVPPVVTKIDRDKTPPPEVLAKAKKATPVKPAKPIKDGTLGLPRLETSGAAPGNAARIAPQKFEVDPLAVPAGAQGLRKAEQMGVNYLAVDPGTEWSRPLRGNPHDVTFVSLNLHASIATVIDAGGAWVSVLESDKPGRATLVVGEPDKSGALTWRKLGYESPRESFVGREMAALPILTLRLDPANDTWDLYCGLRQVAAGLPLAADSQKAPSAKSGCVPAQPGSG